MTRETKIGLLLGLGVILLIGIILSDQISQRQQGQPADFTEFAGDTQRSIEASDAGAAQAYNPAYSSPQRSTLTPPAASPSDNSTTTDIPDNFMIPEDVQAPLPQRQAMNGEADAPTVINLPVLSSNVGQDSRETADDGVPTLTLGNPNPQTPIISQPLAERPIDTSVTPRVSPAVTGGSVIRHTVLPGQSLTEIARRYYGNGDYWRAIALANPDKVTVNGGVRSGEVLDIPKRDDAVLGLDIQSVNREVSQPVDIRSATNQPRTIEIKAGDTLSHLASKYLGSAGRWDELLAANKDLLDDPTQLRVGMKLKLPAEVATQTQPLQTQAAGPTATRGQSPAVSAKTYTVKPGDNLTAIAEKMLGDGDRWREVFEANRDKLKSADQVAVGQQLRIPS